MIFDSLQSAMLLWIPVFQSCPEESDEMIASVTSANGAVQDFCSSLISLDDMLQIVEHCDANVDDYLANLGETIRTFGA